MSKETIFRLAKRYAVVRVTDTMVALDKFRPTFHVSIPFLEVAIVC